MIKTARAAESELKTSTPCSVAKWAKCGLTNSERDVQRVVKSQKLALPLPLTYMTLQNKKLPFIRSIDWLNYIVTEAGQWHRLAGLQNRDPDRCAITWSAFWAKFRVLEPDHQIFGRLSEDELSRTAACYFHLDEGRSLKRTGIMIMSFHSALGFGFKKQKTRGQREARDGGPMSFYVNYSGATLTNRFLLSVIPKKYYEKTPLLLNDVFDLVGKDFGDLIERGVLDKFGQSYRVCILGVKADWPALVRCGGLLRSYNHGPKRRESKLASKGVCHLCEAGGPGIPFEDIGSQQPLWAYTIGASLPWQQTPELLRYLPHNPAFPASFFCIDPWHTMHMGIGKSFISSAMTLALAFFPAGGINRKFEALTESYLSWCKTNGTAPFTTRITRDTLNWKKLQDEPAGSWNKGNLTSLFCRWFEDVCNENQELIEPQGMLHVAWEAVKFLNRFIRRLYKSEVFISGDRAHGIAEDGMSFLQLYQVLAQKAFEQQKPLFPLLPKIHFMDHIVRSLMTQSKIKGVAWNPMILGNQMEEDFIGRPSRLSRRVSPRLTATRTIERYLIATRAAWLKAEMIR